MTPDDRRKHHDAHTSLVNEILNALARRADVMAWKGRAGTFALPGGRGFVDIEPVGIPDIVGVLTGGRWLLCEVKTGAAKLSASQRNLRARFEELGASWCTAHSVAEALAHVEALVSR